MTHRFVYIFAVFISLLTGTVSVSANTIKGTVTDTSGTAVSFATVRLTTPDSVYVTGTVTNEAGAYVVSGIKQGKYAIAISCMGYGTFREDISVDNEGETIINAILKEEGNTLNELVVTGDRYIRTIDGMKIYPDKQQLKHSGSGFDLINNLMIPGVTVNLATGSVNAFGGSVSIYIDGMKSDYREMQQLRPSDVESIQYMEAPTGKYAGDNASINIILKKKNSGGYVSADALQQIGYAHGDYNLSMKYYNKNMQYTAYLGAGFKNVNGDREEKNETILFPESMVNRNYTTDFSRGKSNNQYGQFRVRNKNDKRTLRATFNFVRDAIPENTYGYSLAYTGLPTGNRTVNSSQNETSRNYLYSLGLSGNFNIRKNQFIDASLSGSVSRNHYDYLYEENSESVASNTLENLYNIQGNINYGIRFAKGNALTFKFSELYNVSSANYSGNNSSWQHLWTSESILFAEYMQPLWGKASLSIAPGITAQVYRLHGRSHTSNVGPRAQLTFSVKPARNQYVQLNAAYGNSFPQLAFLTDATRQVDMIQQKRGNPDLKQTRMIRAMAVYGMEIRNVNFQALFLYNGASRLPLSYYYIDRDMLVETYNGNGRWNQYNGIMSVTWMPMKNLNLQLEGGYMYNGYSKAADISAACWYANLQGSYYLGNFAFFARMSTPQKVVGIDLTTTRTIWNYSVSARWTKNAFRAEVGFNNPFYKHPYYERSISSAVYSGSMHQYSRTDRQSIYVKLSYYLDFGKKTKHDKVNVDRTIDSGILKAK